MEVRTHGKFRQSVFPACTRESCSGQCKQDLGTGSMDPIVHLTGAVVIWRGTSFHFVTLLLCVSGSHYLSANHVNN